jgi:hypothetical protein
MRALSLGGAFEEGLQIERKVWPRIAALHVGWAGPMSVLHLGAALVLGQSFDAALETLQAERRLDPGLVPFLGLMFSIGVVQSLSATVLRVGLARLFAAGLLGRPQPGLPRLWGWLREQLSPALLVALRLELVLGAALLLLVLAIGAGAGLVTLAAATGSNFVLVLGVGLGVALTGAGVWFALRWALRVCLAPIVFAVEEGSPDQALARSRSLLEEGGTGRLFVALFVSALASAALAQGVAGLFPSEAGALISAVETAIFLFGWLPFEAYFSRVLTLLYLDRRVRTEGLYSPASA